MLTCYHWVEDQTKQLREKPLYIVTLDPMLSEGQRISFEEDLCKAPFFKSVKLISPEEQLVEMEQLFDLSESIQDPDLSPLDSTDEQSKTILDLPYIIEFQIQSAFFDVKDTLLNDLAGQTAIESIQQPVDGHVLPITFDTLARWTVPVYVIFISLIHFVLIIGHWLASASLCQVNNDEDLTSRRLPWLTFQWFLVIASLFASYLLLFHSKNLINFIYLPVIPVVAYATLYTMYFLIKGKRKVG